ncbi:MAG: hypothetical protein L0Y66_09675 [Myxococcaceae bacterium]|nr:hypothetical protein [Myxococcaceae bacterium]MCI0673902.1 hypothetical protein [Myxococcaceae bacterium]
MLRSAICLALCTALTASAQTAPTAATSDAPATPAPETATPSAPQPAEVTAPSAPQPAEAVSAGASREELAAFLEQHLSFDEKTGEATTGRARRPVPRTQLYELLGRPDLVAQSDARVRTRTWMFVGAAGALVAGVASGVYMHATLPDLNSGWCAAGPSRFNSPECAPRHAMQVTLGSTFLAVGAGAGLALGLSALNIDLHPVHRSEVSRMVSTYNSELRKRLRDTGASASAPSASLMLMPVVGPGGAGLHAQLTF